MTTRTWECNWQREEGGRWESRNTTSREQARGWAEMWASVGAWNANWQACTGNETRPAWTVRNGERRS